MKSSLATFFEILGAVVLVIFVVIGAYFEIKTHNDGVNQNTLNFTPVERRIYKSGYNTGSIHENNSLRSEREWNNTRDLSKNHSNIYNRGFLAGRNNPMSKMTKKANNARTKQRKEAENAKKLSNAVNAALKKQNNATRIKNNN
jgi:hypothetical protein